MLYDAVAIVASSEGAKALAGHAPAIDFLRDAHAHCKFIGYVTEVEPLIAAAGLAELVDDGWIQLSGGEGASARFAERCVDLRFWDREPTTLAL